MRVRICYQQGGEYHGRVARRSDRYAQDDARGQYPRPRDNTFVQQPLKPRVPVRPQPAPPREAAPQEPAPQRPVYREGEAQYEKPVTPYVPDFIRESQRRSTPTEHKEYDMPIGQAEYIRQQNPYTVVSEKNTEPRPAIKRRTLILMTALAALVLAGIFTCQMIFTAQTQAVYAARAAAEQSVADSHPYSYQDLIEEEAYANNLQPAFVAAIILNESSFNPKAESYRGARGLMQMMPETAEWIFDSIGGAAEYSFDLMYQADLNITYGCWYLNYLSEKFNGDPILVAAAFHSGQTNVLNWLNDSEYSSDQKTIALENMPDGNTKAYVQKVLNAYAAYKRLYYEEVNS